MRTCTVCLCASLLFIPIHAIIANPSGCVRRTVPPKNAICGQHVVLDDFTNVEPLVVKNIGVCRDLLWARHQTQVQTFLPNSFIFNERNHSCQLYSSPKVQPNNASETVLFDVRCFDCPNPCPQQVGIDLVGNGDFEASTELIGPWDLSDSGQRLISPGNYSLNAISLFCGLDNGGCVGPSQDINVCEGTAYYIQFNFRFSVSQGTGHRNFGLDSNDGWIANDAATPRNVWLREGHTLDPFPVSFDSVVGFSSKSGKRKGDHFDLDDIRLIPLPSTFPVANEALSVVMNGGFEDGTIKPWRYRTEATFFNVSILSPGINSPSALYFSTPRKGSQFIKLIQVVTTTPGTQYVVSLNTKYRSGKQYQYEGEFTFERKARTAYKLFNKNSLLQAIFTAPTNTTTLGIYLPYDGKEPLIIDNISVAQFAGIKSIRQDPFEQNSVKGKRPG